MTDEILAKFAEQTSKILIETKSVLFNPSNPFVLTSAKKSPVYVDCRKLIAFPKQRTQLIQMAIELLTHKKIIQEIDVVAGGETAGIAYSAFIADRTVKPMAYIRKKPKGFGRDARIEGDIKQGDNVLLVEDMVTDGGSKLSFIGAIDEQSAFCNHCFVIFSYGIFPDKLSKVEKDGDFKIHSLATWWDVVGQLEKTNYFENKNDLNCVKKFLDDPKEWQSHN